jgi:hypothetical protein
MGCRAAKSQSASSSAVVDMMESASRTGRTANPPCLAGGFGNGACKPRLAKPFIESKVSRPVGSLEPRQGFSTRPIYVSFEVAVAVYPVGGTSRRDRAPRAAQVNALIANTGQPVAT